MELPSEALDLIVEAAELQGQIRYNREMDSGRVHKLGELMKQYRQMQEPLQKYKDIPQVKGIIDYFEQQRSEQESGARAPPSQAFSSSAGLIQDRE